MTLLTGRAVVVTGAGRGIGAAVAQRAARQGASVVINDIDLETAEALALNLSREGLHAIAHGADITKWDEAEALVNACVETFGALDGLVNNAGLFGMGRLEELVPADLERMLSVNVCGSAFCASHAARQMVRQQSGTIVNIVSGAQMGIPAMGAYGASKGAMASFTYAWAQELGEHGVRVNAVSPLAATRMVETTQRYQKSRNLPVFEQGQPPADSNAPAVCFLLSDKAAAINGQILRSEGRQLSLIAHPLIIHPPIEHDDWDEMAIAAAFAARLGQRLSPSGIASGTVAYEGSGSGFWDAQSANGRL